MKKHRFLIFAVISLSVMLAISGCSGNSDSGTSQDKGNNNNQGTQQKEESIFNGHEYVDLGLPSGTKWATCNVGATSPKEYGDYFAWGETKPKNTYTVETYMYFSDPATLPSTADAATANWGAGWRMPTEVEWEELKSKCKWTWMSNGYKVVGPNGNGFFLPAAGYRRDSDLNYAGSDGYYWSSSLHADGPGNAWYLYFNSGYYGMYGSGRFVGQSVRPVCVSAQK